MSPYVRLIESSSAGSKTVSCCFTHTLNSCSEIGFVICAISGQTRTATLVVEEKYLNFDQQGAYATAFLLAMVSVACIVVVAIIRPKNHS